MFGKIFKTIINVILFGLIIVGIFVVFSFVKIPGNYKVFTVQSGSMEPTIKTGGLIFVKPISNYAVGDIVTRKTQDKNTTITHRIFSKEDRDGQVSFVAKGDANNAQDGEVFTQDKIVGKEFFTIPFLGYLTNFAKTKQGMILLIVIPAILIINEEMGKIMKEIERLKMKRLDKKGVYRFEDKKMDL